MYYLYAGHGGVQGRDDLHLLCDRPMLAGDDHFQRLQPLVGGVYRLCGSPLWQEIGGVPEGGRFPQ